AAREAPARDGPSAGLLLPGGRRPSRPARALVEAHPVPAQGRRVVLDAPGRRSRCRGCVWFYPEPIEHADFLRGHVAVYWNEADEWYAEDAQLFGHPRDPYARIDVYPTSRRVRVVVNGEPVADTTRARILFESNLPPRYYIASEDVRLDLLEASSKHTRCA